MNARRLWIVGSVSVALLLLVLAGVFAFPRRVSLVPTVAPVLVARAAEEPPVPVPEPHLAMPAVVRGIYATARTVGSARWRDLLGLIARTEINSVVIDLKGDEGELAFAPHAPELFAASSTIFLPPLEELTRDLHARGVYVIGRVYVFQDSWYAEHASSTSLRVASGGLWRDHHGHAWQDPASEAVWAYNAAIAREAWFRGFDEIQFDYIRFPTDGNVKAIVYPVWEQKETKRQVITRFFTYLHDHLEAEDISVSVDLFGLTVRLDQSDLGIGQHTRDALLNVTAVSPMMYPSHYGRGAYGVASPAAQPGAIIKRGMHDARLLLDEVSSTPHATIRPWLQDFNLGAVYTPAMVRVQIDEAEQGGASGWLLWNARNVYTEAAFHKE